jgi:hypothetical protein
MIVVRTPPGGPPPAPSLEEVALTSEELARYTEQRRRYDRNLAVFEAQAVELGDRYPGKFICIAGGTVYVADTPQAAIEQGKAAHPEDWGAFFTKYISPHRGPKVYAVRGRLADR